jgi:transposase
MAMGKQRRGTQKEELFYANEQIQTPGHPFYQGLNDVLNKAGFDEFCEQQCAMFFYRRLGRPSTPPGGYFCLLLIGFFEGIDSERGIAWRVPDSWSQCKHPTVPGT